MEEGHCAPVKQTSSQAAQAWDREHLGEQEDGNIPAKPHSGLQGSARLALLGWAQVTGLPALHGVTAHTLPARAHSL